MIWKNFIQVIIFFILLLLSIIMFELLELDVNFIITFIIMIFTLFISIFFFIESNKVANVMKEKLSLIKEGIDAIRWHNVDKVKDLNISDTFEYRNWEDENE